MSMNRSFETWAVEVDAAHEGTAENPRVRIDDPRAGWAVTVTLDLAGERARLTSLVVEIDDRDPIDTARLSSLPLRTITEVAAAHVDRFRANRAELDVSEAGDDGADLFADYAAAAEASTGRTGRVLQRRQRPPLDQFAKVWLSAKRSLNPTADGRNLPKREWLANHYGVNVQTVDKWTKAARDADLLPRPTTGKGHTIKTNTTNKEKDR